MGLRCPGRSNTLVLSTWRRRILIRITNGFSEEDHMFVTRLDVECRKERGGRGNVPMMLGLLLSPICKNRRSAENASHSIVEYAFIFCLLLKNLPVSGLVSGAVSSGATVGLPTWTDCGGSSCIDLEYEKGRFWTSGYVSCHFLSMY